MSNTFAEILKTRRSTRKFKEELIQPEQLEQVLKAGLMAPSSKRSLSWDFVVVEDKEKLKALSTCRSHGGQFLAHTPIAIVVVGNPLKSDVWIEDGAIATILMQLAAEEIGLGSCWVQIRSRYNDAGQLASEMVKQLLLIPDEHEVLCILALGVKDEQKKPFDEEKLAWEKIRLEQFLYTDNNFQE